MPVPTSYSFYNILFEIFCIAITSTLLYKQVTAFNENSTQKAFTTILCIQIIYFITFIFRVLIDVAILPKTTLSVTLISILNFGTFAYCGYRVFIYLRLYHGMEQMNSLKKRLPYAIPFLINIAMLLSSPITHVYFWVDEAAQTYSGGYWMLMVAINVLYPLMALILFIAHDWDEIRHGQARDFKITVAFPLFFIVFGPLSSLQWRIPILPIGLILADLFVYIHYTDLLMRERNRGLEREKELSDAQNKAKSEFLSNMSHDIRTPMNAIIGFTNLAVQNPEDTERVTEYLGKIQASSNHLLSLINDVLEMSRIESGKIDLEETPCSLPEILHDLNTIIVGQVEQHHHELYMDAVNVTDENVYCDKLRLNQVLLNLLGNAIKYTPDGGKIGVRVVQREGAPEGFGTYEIHVKDNGIGMTPEFAAKVFEAFEREKTSTVSGIQGTGLGMAITKRIVDLMDGTITVETEPGVGSEFIVTVNLRLQDGKAPALRIAELEGVRALVVDDDYDTCNSITNMLAEMGLNVDWTLSGKEAIARAKQEHERGKGYELFLLDLRLDDMNGLDVSRRLRSTVGDDPTVLLVTAYDWSSLKDEALEAGVSGFASKPVFKSELYDKLVQTFRGSSTNVEKTEEAEKVTMDFTGKRLMLVDDIELNREIAMVVLEMNDFMVEEACDGTEAVEKMKNSEPGYFDAILMDIQMPTMNGYDATRAIRALDDPALAQVPIIAMTANAFDEDKKMAFDAGMDGHVAKPIDVDRLMETLEEIFSR